MSEVEPTDDETVENAAALVLRIAPILAGQDLGVQGAALVELVAIWLAGHPPEIRPALMDNHVKFALDLARTYDRRMKR